MTTTDVFVTTTYSYNSLVYTPLVTLPYLCSEDEINSYLVSSPVIVSGSLYHFKIQTKNRGYEVGDATFVTERAM